MRVLVCGGREYQDFGRVERFMENLLAEHLSLMVITGCAPGADDYARRWARHRQGVSCQDFPADWSRGPKAGPERNARMLAEGKPDLVVAFPGGRGTADMVRRARKAGVEVIEVQ